MASHPRKLAIWQKSVAAHFGVSLLLAPYLLWRFPNGPEHGAAVFQKVALGLADLLSGLLLYLPMESLYTAGFTGRLGKPEIFFAEPDLWLYSLLVPINSLIYGVIIAAVLHLVRLLRARRPGPYNPPLQADPKR